MTVPNTMNIYDLVTISPKPDVAAILSACATAIRESTSFLDAWEELGYEGVDTTLIEDIESDRELTLIALACVSSLSRSVDN